MVVVVVVVVVVVAAAAAAAAVIVLSLIYTFLSRHKIVISCLICFFCVFCPQLLSASIRNKRKSPVQIFPHIKDCTFVKRRSRSVANIIIPNYYVSNQFSFFIFIAFKQSTVTVSQKTAPFYFCNKFVRPGSILIIFGTHVL